VGWVGHSAENPSVRFPDRITPREGKVMAKHVYYDESEVVERMQHEFKQGMESLDELEAQIRERLDALPEQLP